MNLFEDKNSEIKPLPFKIPNSEGYSFRWDEENKIFIINIPNGELIYSETFFDKKISDRSVDYFFENDTHNWKETDWKNIDPSVIHWKNVNWRHDKIKMFGKVVPLPRFSAWYGNDDKPYTYSGLTLQPNAWNKGLIYIKEQIEKVSEVSFNSVLMNWYRDGDDYISWHADAEPELGKNPVIGSVNFGATRRFLLRRFDDNKEKIEIPLKHGTFLLMRGETQHFWQHSVPKEAKVNENRLNLTFRIINK